MNVGDRWSEGLPSFGRPPVVEVAVGVHFLTIPGLDIIKMVKLHEFFATDFPKLQQQPALPAASLPNSSMNHPFQIVSSAPPSRLWMLSEDESFLIQVQNDRLLLNWRKTLHNADPYPRYEVLRDMFVKNWNQFVDYIETNNLGAVQPGFAEVTFFNRLNHLNGESLRDYLSPLNSDWRSAHQLTQSYETEIELRDVNDSPVGLQNVKANYDARRGHFSELEITSRIGLQYSSGEVVLAGLDYAHSAGVTTFDSTITSYAMDRWERQ